MNSRERVICALNFQKTDRVPFRARATSAGLFEHGEKLRNLWKQYPGDFGDPSGYPIPQPEPEDVQPDGSYHRVETDEWGTVFEYRIFGLQGKPLKRPLDDLSNLDKYKPPAPPKASGDDFSHRRAALRRYKERYYFMGGFVQVFQQMHRIRRFESCLADMERNTPEINKIADMVTDYYLCSVKYYLALGADGIWLGDDFGTQRNLMISLKTWRRFLKPRYERILKPVKEAGKDIFCHTDGHILPLIDDFAELGIKAIWPQLGANENEALAEKLSEHRICLWADMERQRLMPWGKPREIDLAVRRVVELFGPGLIFDAVIDKGYPFENIRALYQAINKYGTLSGN